MLNLKKWNLRKARKRKHLEEIGLGKEWKQKVYMVGIEFRAEMEHTKMLCSTCDKSNVYRKLKVLGIPILKTKDITPNSIQNEHTKKAATMSMQL